MVLVFVAIGFLLLPYVASSTVRVVNGTDAEEGQYPFMVSLRYYNAHICGGTVLNARNVLTAAHCMCLGPNEPNPSYAANSTIQFNILEKFRNFTKSIPVQHVKCNEYNASAMYIYDVAILTLEEAIPEDHLYRVTLEDRDNVTAENRDAIVLGWGRNFTNGYSPDVLQIGEYLLYNDTLCDASWGGRLSRGHHVCSGWPENGRGSCQGDSGGPLLVDGYQVGVVSFGAAGNCGISNTTHPKVLARVPAYIDFIKRYAGEVLLASEVSSSASVASCAVLISFLLYFRFLF